MIGEISTASFLLAAVITGLATMQRHKVFFSDFTVGDLLHGRVDGWLYVANSLSTTTCLILLVLRISWLVKVGFVEEDRWGVLWLICHALSAICSSVLHLTTYNLLHHDGVCRLCKRRY